MVSTFNFFVLLARLFKIEIFSIHFLFAVTTLLNFDQILKLWQFKLLVTLKQLRRKKTNDARWRRRRRRRKHTCMAAIRDRVTKIAEQAQYTKLWNFRSERFLAGFENVSSSSNYRQNIKFLKKWQSHKWAPAISK